jgi:hypothetical protein
VADAPADVRAATDELIAYHAKVSGEMTAARTNLESALIPVTSYIVIAAVECFHRHADMVRAIDAAMPAERIGAAGRRPGSRVNAVHLWSQANIYLTGRKVLLGLRDAGALPDLVDDPDDTWAVLDFWRRAASSYRGNDGTLQAWDAGGRNTPYGDDVVRTLVDAAAPVTTEEQRTRITRALATLYAYLFLLYFDTRVGTADTGPYPLPGGRTLLVRDFYRLSESEFPWSHVAREVPFSHLTAGIVLGPGVDVRCDDWGTTTTAPADWAPFLEAFSLFETDERDGSLSPLDPLVLDDLVAVVRRAQADHYRNVAGMTHTEKIDAGAFVYFTFLKPFAEVAGVADDLDWSVPVASAGPLYDFVSTVDWSTMPAPDPTAPYYPPLQPCGA